MVLVINIFPLLSLPFMVSLHCSKEKWLKSITPGTEEEEVLRRPFSSFRERKRHIEDHTALLRTSGLSFLLLYETPISFYLVPQIISLPTFTVFSFLFLFRKFKALKLYYCYFDVVTFLFT